MQLVADAVLVVAVHSVLIVALERMVAEKLQTMAGTWTVVGGMIPVAEMETEADRLAATWTEIEERALMAVTAQTMAVLVVEER